MPVGLNGEPLPYPDASAGNGGGDIESALGQIRDLLRDIAGRDGTITEQERLKIEKILTAVQELSANREKEQQAALGGGPATNFLRRAFSG